MELSKKLVVELCDLQICSTSNDLNCDDDKIQQTHSNNDIESVESSDRESVKSLQTINYGNVNGRGKDFHEDKKLVVELCDIMVCCTQNCEKIQEHTKRKVDQQYSHSRKKYQMIKKIGSSDEDTFEDDKISDKEEMSEDEISDEDSDHCDWRKSNVSRKKKKRKKQGKIKDEKKQEEISEEEISDEEEISEEEIPDEDSDDCDWQEEVSVREKRKRTNQREKRKRTNQKKKEGKKTQKGNLSNFELIRQKHLEDKMEFLKSLMISEIKDELEDTAKSLKRKHNIVKPKPVLEVLRKSERMKNLNMNLSEQALQDKVYGSALEENTGKPTVYSFEDAFFRVEKRSLDDYDKYFMNMEIKEEASDRKFPYDLGRLDPTQFVSRFLPFTLSSFTFHPAVDRTIVLAGSTSGQIALWNTNAEPYIFTPHTDQVSLIKVNSECPSQIFSSSSDGTLRRTDIENKCFVEIFKDETVQYKYFDFISPQEYLIARSDGCVSMMDCRERSSRSGFKSECRSTSEWKCSNSPMRTISAHPTKKDLCLSLDADGLMKVWDRRLQRKSVSCEKATDRNVLYAIFSPVTGNSVLCSSKITISIYDSSHLEEKLNYNLRFNVQDNTPEKVQDGEKSSQTPKKVPKLKNTLYLNQANYYTMAKWLPRSDTAFIVTNNCLKKIAIFESNNGQEMSRFNAIQRNVNNLIQSIVFQEVHPVNNMLAVSLRLCQRSIPGSKICIYV